MFFITSPLINHFCRLYKYKQDKCSSSSLVLIKPIRNCLDVCKGGVGKKKKVLVKSAGVGRTEQQWNYQRLLNPSGEQASLDTWCMWCSPFFLAWRAPARAAGKLQLSVRRMKPHLVLFRGSIFSPHRAFTRVISCYIKKFSRQHLIESVNCSGYFQIAVIRYIHLQEKGADVMQGLVLLWQGQGLKITAERRLGQLHCYFVSVGHHSLCDFSNQNCCLYWAILWFYENKIK